MLRTILASAVVAASLASVPAFAGSATGNAIGLNGGLGVAGGYGNNSLNTLTKTITTVATGHAVIAGGSVKQTTKLQSNTTLIGGASAPFSPELVSVSNSN